MSFQRNGGAMTHIYDLEEFVGRQFSAQPAFVAFLDDFGWDNFRDDGPWIAGGCLRRMVAGEPFESDIDLFFSSRRQADAMRGILGGKGFKEEERAERAYLYVATYNETGQRVAFDLHVREFFDSAEDVIDGFDFTLCQFALAKHGNAMQFLCGDYALADLGARALIPNPPGIWWSRLEQRLAKYESQGFRITAKTVASLMAAKAANRGHGDR